MSHFIVKWQEATMIKLASFIVFTAAFIWSWCLFHSKSPVDISVHAGIQSKLAVMIEDAIHKARPNASDFQMITLYTKNLEDNKISAFFSYRYTETLQEKEQTDQIVKGEAILNRTVSENPEEQKWVVQSVKTDNATIEFHEGSIIKSGGETPQADEKENAEEGSKEPVKNAGKEKVKAPAKEPAKEPAQEEKKTE
jgi:hypothetical protein